MRDCNNVTMRERLPELLHGLLPETERAEVDAHVAACADCRAELALLRRIVDASPAPAVNVAAVAKRIPAHQPASWAARALRSTSLRAAAAVILLAGAVVVSQRGVRIDQPDTVVASAGVASTELSIGALAEISDSDLEALLDELTRLEPVTSTEPEIVVVPAVRGGTE